MPSPLDTAIDRLDILGAISDSPSHLVRTFLSPASRRAALAILEWMEALGMETSHSSDGTVRGILKGSHPESSPLLLGSHYDTVIDAGKYDGPLGIIASLAALETLRQENTTLPFPVHVLAFSDEEGTRFQTTYLGSRGIVGNLDNATLAIRDGSGVTIAAALEDSGWQDGASVIRYAKGKCRGYVELHIEQGRVLEEARQPACVVTSIAGQSRLTVTLDGRADHAGTTPMHLRRDALTGAAECVIAAETLAKSQPPLVITVGKMQVHPGASNSVPQRCIFTIDLRHPDNPIRREALETLHDTFTRIANARDLGLDWHLVQENDATPCDPALTQTLIESLTAVTGSQLAIPSGAGHDGVIVSKIGPIAMLFIRCRDGLSHHPDEYASREDIGTGIGILTHFLKSLPA
jgi:allantoate deiminase